METKTYSPLVEQFRKVIPRMSQLHEESFIADGKGWGKYTKDEFDSAREACKEVGLPEELAYLLYLLYYDMNDISDWAENPSEILNQYVIEKKVQDVEVAFPNSRGQ